MQCENGCGVMVPVKKKRLTGMAGPIIFSVRYQCQNCFKFRDVQKNQADLNEAEITVC